VHDDSADQHGDDDDQHLQTESTHSGSPLQNGELLIKKRQFREIDDPQLTSNDQMRPCSMIVGGHQGPEQMRSFWIISGDQFGVGIIAMQRRPNWKPVIVPSGHRDENPAMSGAKGVQTGDEDRLVDIRFTIGAALALGLPALIGAVLYLAVTVLLRLS
jgi:hypothetical protein